MKKKYVMTNSYIEYKGRRLYRIKAIRSFDDVKEGDLGGYIEHEGNLSHWGNCWVYDSAMVVDNAKVIWNGKVYDNALVCEHACITQNAKVRNSATISGYATISENAIVCGEAIVRGTSLVIGNATIKGTAVVKGDARIKGNSQIYDNAVIYGNAIIQDNAHVYGHADVFGKCVVCKNAKVYGYVALKEGIMDCDIKDNIVKLIACSTGYYPNPQTNTYIFFIDNPNYKEGEIVEATYCDPDFLKPDGSGLYVSTPYYLNTSNLIAVEVHIDDIITCVFGGKIRCKRMRILGKIGNK